MPRRDCAPLSLDQQAEFFAENGFCVVPGCFQGEALSRLQASWRRAQRPARELWEGTKAGEEAPDLPHGKLWFDIPVPTLLQEADEGGDPILLELLSPAPLLPVLERVVGNAGECTNDRAPDSLSPRADLRSLLPTEICGIQPR